MGGYGAVIAAGGGVTQASTELPWGAPAGTLQVHKAGSDTHEALIDPRIKAVVAFAPWGMTAGFWDEGGAQGACASRCSSSPAAMTTCPATRTASRRSSRRASNAERYLLTFEYANHNAGAPMPPPAESWQPSEHLDFIPFDHYADPVWDNVRMNNISQHFVTAFLGQYLKGDNEMAAYLDIVEHSRDACACPQRRRHAESPSTITGRAFRPALPRALSLMHRQKSE